MKGIFSIQSKLKVALSLLAMVVLLLCGVLLERNFFGEINEASSSIYKDRLIPSAAVYHLSDHVSQRKFILDGHLATNREHRGSKVYELAMHQHKEDSILKAFEQTYLVDDERKSLDQLKLHLATFNEAQAGLIEGNGQYSKADLDVQFLNIRNELLELSTIQTRVGKKLYAKSEALASKAGMVSQFLVVILIVVCLISQAFILASKAIVPVFKQKHNLN